MSNHDHEGSRPSNGDAALQRAWRNASDEQPPAHLDAAIIAAARKSVPVQGDQPNAAPARVRSRNWLLQWQPLATAATVAGLAFILVQMLPREATDYGQRPSAEKSVARPERSFVPDEPSTQVAVPAPPAAPASPAAIAEATVNDTAATADAAAAAPSAREQGLGKAAALDAAAWAEKIAALHASGDVTAAAGELRAFRAADPVADTYLPDSLREWARTVE